MTAVILPEQILTNVLRTTVGKKISCIKKFKIDLNMININRSIIHWAGLVVCVFLVTITKNLIWFIPIFLYSIFICIVCLLRLKNKFNLNKFLKYGILLA